jgi:SAM-dependent methyltransferase
MSATLQFDDEASRRIEAIYSTPDVVAQRQVVLLALEAKPGERVLDIGAGPGFLAAELAAGVAPDGTVIGTDISESMLAIATARLDSTGSAAETRFEHADACALPFQDESFDAVVCTQVYEYVQDIAKASIATCFEPPSAEPSTLMPRPATPRWLPSTDGSRRSGHRCAHTGKAGSTAAEARFAVLSKGPVHRGATRRAPRPARGRGPPRGLVRPRRRSRGCGRARARAPRR